MSAGGLAFKDGRFLPILIALIHMVSSLSANCLHGSRYHTVSYDYKGDTETPAYGVNLAANVASNNTFVNFNSTAHPGDQQVMVLYLPRYKINDSCSSFLW